MKQHTLITVALATMVAMIAGNTVAQETDAITISPKRQTFYAGGSFAVDISSTLINTPINYRLQFANRTLTRGVVTVGKSGEAQLNLEFPELKQGVVVAAELSCFTDTTKVSKTVYMFSKPALADGIGELSYWQSSEPTGLQDALKDAGVQIIACDDASQATTNSVIIDSMDIDDNPGMIFELSKLCLAGKKVVLLNPTGTLPWPSNSEKMVFEGPAFATKLDKRFDVLPMTNRLVAGELDGEPALKVQAGTHGFCFCRAQIGKGELIILTSKFTEMVSENPTPLYLMKTLLTKKEIEK